MPNLLIIDGNSILNRAYYGIKNLSTSTGTPTNAIYGFIKTFLKLKNKYNPESVVVAFDMSAKTFRHLQYTEYKANRKGMPDELAEQLAPLKQILIYMGISLIEKESFEADDIIGTLASNSKNYNFNCIISTGDRDSFQLINNTTCVEYASTNKNLVYTIEKINEEYELSPHQLIDLKALEGDKSDNIPGVKGIGKKTAITLIKKYNSINNLYLNIDSINETPRIKKLLTDYKKDAFLSLDLGTIRCNVPIESDPNLYKIEPIDNQNLINILTKLELKSIINELQLNLKNNNLPLLPEQNSKLKREINYEIIEDPSIDYIKSVFNNLETIDFISTFKDKEIQNIKLIEKDNKIIVVNKNIDEFLLTLLSINKQNIRTFNSKSLYLYMFKKNLAIDKKVDFDLLLAAYLVNSDLKDYNISKLVPIYLDIDSDDGQPYDDIINFSSLCDILTTLIRENELGNILYNIEIPLSLVLANMEYIGFEIDFEGVKQFGNMLEEHIDNLKKTLFKIAQQEFNPNSTQHLADILYNQLKLKPSIKTKTGYSTNAQALESLIGQHEIIDNIINYRKLSKLNSTYVNGFLKLKSKDNKRVHTYFNQTETRTGRISSIEPNMQNIPIRTPLGREIRKFFVAKPNCILIDADYSQIELRILAHLSNDENMIQDFLSELDIHSATASKIFNIPVENVSSEYRRRAKAINFGIIYGISPFSLSKDINVSIQQASEYIDSYFKYYSNVKKYLDTLIKNAYNDKFVTTMFGRKRFIDEITSSNKNIKMFGERVAMNAPIQGSSADIIKIAMINIHQQFINTAINAKIILQVHDELIIESDQNCVEQALNILKVEMENAAELKVPLVVDIECGNSWYNVKK